MKIRFETERLLLREFTSDDFDALYEVLKDHVKKERIQEWIEWCISSYKKNGFGHFAVVYKKTGEMIGTAGPSMQYIDDDWRPEIGYHLRKDYHRQGLGKEVAKGSLDYTFNNFDFDTLYCYMDEDNIASYKTAESMGMKYLHLYTARDGSVCRVYNITREEWKNQNSGVLNKKP